MESPRVALAGMTEAASQEREFYLEVAETQTLWTLSNDDGVPVRKRAEGISATPFWSSEGRALRAAETVPAFAGFKPYPVDWFTFSAVWAADLRRTNLRCGVNWSGDNAAGYDVDVDWLVRCVEREIVA
ncbi:MAG: DUF2750 domain-containing protein [Planctomycetota bacterium]